MDTGELNAVLEDAGLSPYQADAYATLLELGSASASEIASASGVPQPRIYDILRALEDEGYVVVYEREQLYAQANDPSEALSGLRTAIDRYETAISEIEQRYREPAAEDGAVSLVKRLRTVFEHARENLEGATEHVQLAVTPEQFSDLRPLLRDARDRGVYVQVSLYVPPEEPLPFECSTFENVCTEVRRRDLPGPFLLLTDRQRACYAPQNRPSDEYGVIVDDYTTAYVFHWYFLTRLWEVYETVYNGRSEEPPFSFVEITDCIRGLEPRLEEGANITGRVIGEYVRTGRACELEGEFIGVEYTGSRSDDEPASLLELAAEATIRFETADGVYTVGGRGADTEDVAGKRFIVERIDEKRADK